MKIGSYDGPRDLGDKIETEGSLEYFFVHYTGESFGGSPIESEVAEFRRAYRALHDKLGDLGAYGDV